MTDLIISIVVRAQNGVYRLRDEEQAQTLTEYALIIAVIALGVLVALYFLKDQLKAFFSKAGKLGPERVGDSRLTARQFETGKGVRMINTLMLKAIVSAQNGIARLRDEEEAQTLTEYALIIAVIAIGVLVALYFLRDQIKNLFSKTGSSINCMTRGPMREGLPPLPHRATVRRSIHFEERGAPR